MRKKLTLAIFCFLILPLGIILSTISLLQINRAFQMIKSEVVNIHTTLPLNQNNYLAEEEAVIVLTKIGVFSKIININLNQLPREFIIKALLKSGEVFFSVLTDPTHLIQAELIKMSKDHIISIMKREEISVTGGEIPLSYIDTNNQKQSTHLYYSMVKNKDESLSLSIYSQEHLPAPLSIPGFFTNSTQWNQEGLENSFIRPFIATLSGKISVSNDRFFFNSTPSFAIEFPKDQSSFVFPTKPSFFDNVKKFAGDLFSSAGNFLKGSLSALSGVNIFGSAPNSHQETFVSLDNLSVETKINKEVEKSVTEAPPKKEKPSQKDDVKEEKSVLELIKVEINSAKGEELELLSGIGPTYAERIIDARPFCSLDDLTRVSGIGEKTVNNIKTQKIAYVDPPASCLEKKKIEKLEEEDPIEEENKEALLLFLEIQKRLQALRGKIEKLEEEDPIEEKIEKEESTSRSKEEIKEVEINSASKEELDILSGIGSFLAERIIEARPFCSLDDLLLVSGIGETTLKKIKDQGVAYVDPPASCLEDEEEEEEDEEEEEEEENIMIEINSASTEELEKITGVGPVTAQKIIDGRPFCSLDDLVRVSGIGETTVNNIKLEGIAYVDPPASCLEEEDNNEEDVKDFNILVEGASTVENTPLSFQNINPSSSPTQLLAEIIVKYNSFLLKLELGRTTFLLI